MKHILKRKLPSTGDKTDDISTKIRDLFDTSDQFRQGLFCGKGLEHKLRGDYRSYRGWVSPDDSDIQNKHSILMVFSMVRAILAELMGRPPAPKIKGKRFSTLLVGEIVNAYLKRQAELSGSFKVHRDATTMKILHGTGIIRKGWCTKKYEYEHKAPGVKVDEATGTIVPTEEKIMVEDIIYDGWKDTFVSLMNFYWDPFGTDMESCYWVAEADNYFTIADMYKYIDQGIFQVSSKDRKDIENAYTTAGEFMVPHVREDYQTSDPSRQDNISSFPLLRYFTDTEVFYLLVLGDGSFKVMNQDREFQANPYKIKHNHRKPYIHSQFWPLPGEFLGLGIGDMANGYQFYANKAQQMELDAMKMNLLRKFIVRKNAIVNTDHLLDDSNLLVWVKDMDGIRDLPPINTMGAGINMMKTIQQSAEQDLGINKIMQGNRLEGSVSATEAAEVASMGRKQLSVPFFNHMEAVKEHFKLSCGYNFLFLEPDTLPYNGEDAEITNDMFDLNNLEMEVDETSVSANFEALWQKRIEMMAQALEPHLQFGYVNIKAIDTARVVAAGLDPRDYIKMDGNPAFSAQDEAFLKNAQHVTAMQEAGLPGGMPPAPEAEGNPAAMQKGPVQQPGSLQAPGADTIGSDMLREAM